MWFSPKRRHKEAFLDQPSQTSQPRRPQPDHYSSSGQWQLIVKLAGVRSWKPNRWSSAYEAITRKGDCLFYGVHSSVRSEERRVGKEC